ncbi:hypothetical protein GCM10010347_63930 [Streptomyces cirratus]|uniref:Uncharacterized protein n=1 Tax=Streptomyces cirratus TaxID=68187 RepID=A0ABQ3F281_9ACTN|nr:hypothetical protein [Streptomyces cirratus]GHB84244.1 hypothetical protein GCM10010347_63930 [Streptomyces cirratus]
MSNNDPVNPAEVPVFTGELAVLDEKVKALSGDGGALANAGSSVHTTFGGLSAYYKAPEAEQLFAVTKPVVDITMSFSGDMCTIAGALGTYANEIRPLVKKLETLKAEAASFKSKVSGDHKWNEDGDLVEENLDRRNDIAEVWSQFQAAERTAYDKIVALVCGTPLKVDDGSHGANMYGYDAEALKHSKSLPWGEAVEESVPWWQVWEHAYDFGKGVIVDGVWGTIKGLGTLVGFDGWDATKQAWTGLAKLSTGLAITLTPGLATAYWMADDKDLPPWLRDSRTAMKETGKALLAWDQWSENPSRAAGAVTFNVVTAIFTDGAGAAASGAGKAGVAAKALSFAGKAGRAIDPMTYVFKGAGAGLSKIGDVMAGLKGLGKVEIPKISDGAFSLPDGSTMLPDGTIHLPSGTAVPEGAIKLPDGGIKLPEGTATLPPGTVKLPFDDSPAKYMDADGNLYKKDGSLFQRAADAKPETPPATAHAPKVETPVLVGVGARGGDDVIRLGSDISDPVHVGDHTPTGHTGDHTPGGHAPDGMPRNDLNTTPGTPHPGGDTPSIGGHPDGPGAGSHHPDGPGTGGHPDGPSTGGAHPDAPSTGGPHLPDTPGAGGHQPPASAAPDDATRAAHHAEYEAARDVPAQDRTSEESMAITREHVRLANEDPLWRAEHYDKWGLGKRNNANELVDGQLLPKLIEQPDGSWIAASDLPHAHPGGFHLTPLERGRDTVAPDDLAHLDKVAAKRMAGMDLTAWEKAFDKNPTYENAYELAHAQEHYNLTVGEGVSNNSKLGEELGEEAARRHMLLQEEFAGAKEVDDPPLPDTPNGSKRFDQLWRDKDGNLIIVEAKSPNGVLEWRQSNGYPGGTFKVKQGSIDYVRTIVADMKERVFESPDEAKYIKEIEDGIKNKTLRYVLVQASENTGEYAGAVLKHFKLF